MNPSLGDAKRDLLRLLERKSSLPPSRYLSLKGLIPISTGSYVSEGRQAGDKAELWSGVRDRVQRNSGSLVSV